MKKLTLLLVVALCTILTAKAQPNRTIMRKDTAKMLLPYARRAELNTGGEFLPTTGTVAGKEINGIYNIKPLSNTPNTPAFQLSQVTNGIEKRFNFNGNNIDLFTAQPNYNTGTIVSNHLVLNQNTLTIRNSNVLTFPPKYAIYTFGQNGLDINVNYLGNRGIFSNYDFSNNSASLDYVQKKYVDNAIATHSTVTLLANNFFDLNTITANYTTVFCNATVGSITPTEFWKEGKIMHFIKTDETPNVVNANGVSLARKGDFCTVQRNGPDYINIQTNVPQTRRLKFKIKYTGNNGELILQPSDIIYNDVGYNMNANNFTIVQSQFGLITKKFLCFY